MGMFDTVTVKCPKCGEVNEEQSKMGDCLLRTWPIEDCPDTDVVEDVVEKFPIDCINCGYLIRLRPIHQQP